MSIDLGRFTGSDDLLAKRRLPLATGSLIGGNDNGKHNCIRENYLSTV